MRGGLGKRGRKRGGLGRGEGGPRQNGILRGGLGKWGQRGGLGSPGAVCNTGLVYLLKISGRLIFTADLRFEAQNLRSAG